MSDDEFTRAAAEKHSGNNDRSNDSDEGSLQSESVSLSNNRKPLPADTSGRRSKRDLSVGRNAYDELVGDGDIDFLTTYQKKKQSQENFQERLRLQQDYQARVMGISGRYRTTSEGPHRRKAPHRRDSSSTTGSGDGVQGALVDAAVQTNTTKDRGVKLVRRDAQTAAGTMLILAPLHLMFAGASYCYQWRLFSEILTNTGRSSSEVDILILGFLGCLFSGVLVINLVVLPMALASMTHAQLPLGHRGDSRHLFTAIIAYAIFFSIPVAMCELSLILSSPFSVDVTSLSHVMLSVVSLLLAVVGAVGPLWMTYLSCMVERVSFRAQRIAKRQLQRRERAYAIMTKTNQDTEDSYLPQPRAHRQGTSFTPAQKTHLEIIRALDFSPYRTEEDIDV